MGETGDDDALRTQSLTGATAPTVRRFRLAVIQGRARDRTWESSSDRCSIGSDPSNDVVISDPTVSRFHCEIQVDAKGPLLRDLGSRNGTSIEGLEVKEAYLRDGSSFQIGQTLLRLGLGGPDNSLPVSPRSEFGSLVGASVAMRRAFALLERAAPSDATVLLEGESGTGKEGAAASLHEASPRREHPFVVVDCGSLPPTLLENELFGHERGAFTGATGRHVGAFEEASGGTIFLDEIGELPLEMQPKLLAVLERRQLRRLGGTEPIPIDVRVVAATNRDLRAQVNDGEFRADLYFRLAVITVRLPPLRERREDLHLLVRSLLDRMRVDPEIRDELLSPRSMAQVRRASWLGNVRELRNYLERCVVLGLDLAASVAGMPTPSDESQNFAEARRAVLEAWERPYLEALVAKHGGSVETAARAAGMGRGTLYRMLKSYGLIGK